MIIKAPSLESMGAELTNVLRYPDSTSKHWSAFNPSIARGEDGRLGMTIRSSNYVFSRETKTIVLTTHGIIKNRLFFSYVDESSLELIELRELFIESPANLPIRRGIEDCRLYWRNGRWEVTGVVLESHTPLARIWTFWLDLERNVAVFISALDGPNPKKIEKNWLPVSEGETDKFDFIYNTQSIYKDGTVVAVDGAPKGYEWIRGGSPLVRDGDSYISIVHRVHQESKVVYNPMTFGIETRHLRHYVHQFARWDLSGKLIEITDDFTIREDGIEYACGLVVVGDDYVFSYGRWDTSSWLGKMPIKRVHSMLRPA